VCTCKGGLSLAEIRESARWSRGKITTKRDYLDVRFHESGRLRKILHDVAAL